MNGARGKIYGLARFFLLLRYIAILLFLGLYSAIYSYYYITYYRI